MRLASTWGKLPDMAVILWPNKAGKTALLRMIRERGEAAGMRVLGISAHDMVRIRGEAPYLHPHTRRQDRSGAYRYDL